MRDHHLLHGLLLLLFVLSLLVLPGCEIRTADQLAKEDEIRQATANLAASIFEAMVAIEEGVPVDGPIMATKISAYTIIQTNGRDYVPAKAYVQLLTQKMQPGTGPLPVGAKR